MIHAWCSESCPWPRPAFPLLALYPPLSPSPLRLRPGSLSAVEVGWVVALDDFKFTVLQGRDLNQRAASPETPGHCRGKMRPASCASLPWTCAALGPGVHCRLGRWGTGPWSGGAVPTGRDARPPSLSSAGEGSAGLSRGWREAQEEGKAQAQPWEPLSLLTLPLGFRDVQKPVIWREPCPLSSVHL